MLDIVQIPVLNDNYVYLVRDPETPATAVVDPAVSAPVLDALAARGWRLEVILNTHHHPDHVGGNLELKAATGCRIVGPHAERDRIPGIDRAVRDGGVVELGVERARVYDVPGHTAGHIAYHFADARALFAGDTLFAMGCGRLFEGTPEQMLNSLSRFDALPDDTLVYCAHEYTETNGRFALTVDPDNADLARRMQDVAARRARGEPTVPSLLGDERRTNPFLRSGTEGIRHAVGLEDAPQVEVFAEVRRRKDHF